jgi:protein-tyrosine phosphatase
MKPNGFTDLHQHVLWGLDDGPRTREQMYALLRQDAEEGIHLVFATSHAYPKFRAFDMALYRERLREACEYCGRNRLPITVLTGCEIHYCTAVPDHLAAGKLPTLGNTRRVLIEFDPYVSLSEIGEAADRLYCSGHPPVLAHVERYRCLLRSPERAADMREEYRLIYQMNCETVLRPRGFTERRFVRRMLEARAIDAIATDAHDVTRRPARMKEAYKKIAEEYGTGYADTLVSMGLSFTGEEAGTQ